LEKLWVPVKKLFIRKEESMELFKGEPTEIQKAMARLLENRRWVDMNITELQKKYADKWIVVADKNVLAVKDTPEEAKDAYDKNKYLKEEVLLMRVPLEHEITKLI